MTFIQELIEQAETENQDNKAKKAGFMVAVPGELYIRTLSKSSTVYIERIDFQWESWRETYQKGKPKAVIIKEIESSQSFGYVLMKTVKYFNFISRKRSE